MTGSGSPARSPIWTARLRSMAFAEIQWMDEAGHEIHALEAPVTVRMVVARRARATLPDLVPGNDRVDRPMDSFDRDQGRRAARFGVQFATNRSTHGRASRGA